MTRSLLAALLLLPSLSTAAELSYAVTSLMASSGVEETRGLEFGARFGGEHGDRWSVWLGAVKARETTTGILCHEDDGSGNGCWPVSELPAYEYLAFNHRWYLRPPKARIKLYAGTGAGWRSHEQCVQDWSGNEVGCIAGDMSVSSHWAFSQELGVVWREHLGFSFGHFSTGDISEWNRGDNFLKFEIISTLGSKSK